MPPSLRYECSDRFAWRIVDGKVVILDTASGDYYTLNETATVVWESLLEGRNLDETTEKLMAVFEVDPAEARADIQALIDSFFRDGFLQHVASASDS